MKPSYEYRDLDDAIIQEIWAGNRTHAGIMNELSHMADRYTKRDEGNIPPSWGKVVSWRLARLKRRGIIRKAVGKGKWVPVPAEFRKVK
jgi:hypothetical protein